MSTLEYTLNESKQKHFTHYKTFANFVRNTSQKKDPL